MLAKGGPASTREMAGSFQEQVPHLGRRSSLGAKIVKELNSLLLTAAGSLRLLIHAGIRKVGATFIMKVAREIRHRIYEEHPGAKLLLLHDAVTCCCRFRFVALLSSREFRP